MNIGEGYSLSPIIQGAIIKAIWPLQSDLYLPIVVFNLRGEIKALLSLLEHKFLKTLQHSLWLSLLGMRCTIIQLAVLLVQIHLQSFLDLILSQSSVVLKLYDLGLRVFLLQWFSTVDQVKSVDFRALHLLRLVPIQQDTLIYKHLNWNAIVHGFCLFSFED